MRTLKFAAVLSLAAWLPIRADDYQSIPEDRVEGIAKSLTEISAKVKDVPVKVELNAAKARGLFDEGNQRGMMIVPVKDLKEDRDNPELAKDKGRAIAGIFFYNVLPSGASDKNKLYKIEHKTDDGGEREIRYAVVTVRKKNDDQYFMQIWGSDKEPLCEAQIGETEGDEKFPIDISASNSELTIKLLGKFGTRLGIKEVKF